MVKPYDQYEINQAARAYWTALGARVEPQVDLTPAPVPANCRNCGAPPTAGHDVCTYCDTPHGVVRRKVHRDAHDRTIPRRTLD